MRVLLVQPSLQPPGGGNGVASWMLQALAAEHRVTVLSWRPIDVDPINRFFGTTLAASDFDTIVVPVSWRLSTDHLPVPAALLRSALLMRRARRLADGFDVIVGAHNEADYGRRAIQYVHYPTYLRPRPDVDLRWYHRWTPLLQFYYRSADRVAGFSIDRVRQNLTLANSDWTASHLRRLLAIESITVYPPVVDPAPGLTWSARRRGFLAVGRISPEKEYERIMRIVARVRGHVPDVTLVIIGTTDRHSSRYFARLRRLAERLGPWIEFRMNQPREAMGMLMAAYRYGIHGMREEHFGMAPAEMVRSGAIVWVPRGGGQMEIVGNEDQLLYDTEEEAAQKILRVMTSPDKEQQLRESLSARSFMFSTDRFVHQIRDIVRSFVA